LANVELEARLSVAIEEIARLKEAAK